MTMIKHELKQSRISLTVWTLSIGFLLAVCIFMFPEMKGQMDSVSDMFASMGGFTEAFGMDKVSFGTFIGFYSVECGNILGFGGAFFAALCAVSMLAKEEKEHTAEFLFAHPVSRFRIVSEKLFAAIIQILILNAVIYAAAIGSSAAIGEEIPWTEITLMHLANFIMQLEIAGICFCISAFLKRGSLGAGLGVAIIMFFLNIVANISDSAKFLKYITPFGYADGPEIAKSLELDWKLVLIGMAIGVISAAVGYIKYCKKDIS